MTSASSDLAAVLAGHRPPGVYRWHALTPQREVRDAVELAGWRWGYVAGWSAPDKAAFLVAIGDALAFPGHYGHNLDALWDCLTDLGAPTLVVWEGWARLARADAPSFEVILDLLRSRAEEEPAFAVLLWGEGPIGGVPSLD